MREGGTALTLLVLLHPMDPRGQKLGGIETHVRLMLAHHPRQTRLLLVGTDEIGDAALGEVEPLDFEGRTIDFLPVLRVAPDAVNGSARRVRQSLTLRYAAAVLRRIGTIRGRISGQAATCEIERTELAGLGLLLGCPTVLIIHDAGTRHDQMDSLLKRYWMVRSASERLALIVSARVFAVNEAIAARVARVSRRAAARTTVLAVSVDTGRFRPTAFPAGSTFRVCFAGRLDAFKDPPLMLATLAAAAERLAAAPAGPFDRLAFDYIGASDPSGVVGWQRVAPFTTQHGPQSAVAVAGLMRASHAGLITSIYEGMPCYLLEMLASGRPVVSIALSQFEMLFQYGTAGTLVGRDATSDATAAALADALVKLAASIGAGRVNPETIAEVVRPYAIETQMSRLFDAHDVLVARQPSRSMSAA